MHLLIRLWVCFMLLLRKIAISVRGIEQATMRNLAERVQSCSPEWLKQPHCPCSWQANVLDFISEPLDFDFRRRTSCYKYNLMLSIPLRRLHKMVLRIPSNTTLNSFNFSDIKYIEKAGYYHVLIYNTKTCNSRQTCTIFWEVLH